MIAKTVWFSIGSIGLFQQHAILMKRTPYALLLTQGAFAMTGMLAMYKLYEWKQTLVDDYPPFSIWHALIFCSSIGIAILSSRKSFTRADASRPAP